MYKDFNFIKVSFLLKCEELRNVSPASDLPMIKQKLARGKSICTEVTKWFVPILINKICKICKIKQMTENKCSTNYYELCVTFFIIQH